MRISPRPVAGRRRLLSEARAGLRDAVLQPENLAVVLVAALLEQKLELAEASFERRAVFRVGQDGPITDSGHLLYSATTFSAAGPFWP